MCSGVAVITSTPKPTTSASSAAATAGVSAATSGAEAANPIRPPASRIAVAPPAGRGVPFAMCTRPVTPMISASEPITIRPVSPLRSGWRRNRQPSSASSTGTSQASAPNPPRTTAVITRPTALSMCHQVVAATTMAAPIAASPIPSLRCAGSRSRALRPIPRTTAPTPCASSIHSPRDGARHPAQQDGHGLADSDGPGPARRWTAGRPRPVLRYLRDFLARALRLVFTGARPRGAGSARPPRERAAVCVPLGARVAMMPTLASISPSPKHAAGVSPRPSAKPGSMRGLPWQAATQGGGVRIAVVGGGPGGLYFAALAQQLAPATR